MNGTGTLREITRDTDVYSMDGEKVGSVVAVHPTYVIVEKGVFFPTDYYVPTEAITGVTDGKAFLNVTKDQALNQAWDTLPPGAQPDDAVATGDRTFGAAGAGRATLGEVGAPFQHLTDNPDTHVDGTEKIMVPVHEEDLTATTRTRQIGEVQIEKDVVAEQRTLAVPVTEERVTVQRHAVDRPAEATDAAFREGTFEVPILGEEVELQKQTKVSEEVEIGKEAVQRTEQLSGSVRHEEVRVTEDLGGEAPGAERNR